MQGVGWQPENPQDGVERKAQLGERAAAASCEPQVGASMPSTPNRSWDLITFFFSCIFVLFCFFLPLKPAEFLPL